MKTNCGSSPESITQALDLTHNVTNRTFSVDEVKILLEKENWKENARNFIQSIVN